MYVLCMYLFIVSHQYFHLVVCNPSLMGRWNTLFWFLFVVSFDVYSSTVRFKLNFGQEFCLFIGLISSCVFLIWMCVSNMAFSTFFVCCTFDVVLYFEIFFKDFRFVRHVVMVFDLFILYLYNFSLY